MEGEMEDGGRIVITCGCCVPFFPALPLLLLVVFVCSGLGVGVQIIKRRREKSKKGRAVGKGVVIRGEWR